MMDAENRMVSGYGYFDEEAADRGEARAEWEWEHADDEWNDRDLDEWEMEEGEKP